MLIDFDAKRMNRKIFNPSPERKDKRWSYSFVYYLKDIKSIYVIYNSENRSIAIPELLKYVKIIMWYLKVGKNGQIGISWKL